MQRLLIKDVYLVNERKITLSDILIQSQRIKKIAPDISPMATDRVIEGKGRYLLPGMIDDQVHFREPGLTHKGDLATESRAALAGGTTTVMEMPNVKPPTLTLDALEDKFKRAAERCLTNYSFYLGSSTHNLEQIKRLDPNQACGVKIFMGSSTGNMQVDDPDILRAIFKSSPVVITTHCESDTIIAANYKRARAQYGDAIPMDAHAWIRSEGACFASSSLAVELAKSENARLHVLHLTTAKELSLFTPKSLKELAHANITAEVCVHHLSFDAYDYPRLGSQIKCNPSVKTTQDRFALIDAVNRDIIDIIATDHAPHTWQEKQNDYSQAPSGIPLCQHSLQMLLELYHKGWLSLETLVQKTAHAVAERFQIQDRGYIREGYYADLVLVDLNKPHCVTPESLLYKCGWSPLLHQTLKSSIDATILNGNLAWFEGRFMDLIPGMRLAFKRD